MTVLPILLWPDPRLAQRAFPVGEITGEIEKLAQDMLDTMYDAPGRGLAAPQVGVMRRMFVMDATWKDGKPDPQVFINPEIRERSVERTSNSEGCLSLPGITTEISRPARVRVVWTGLTGGRYEQVFDGFAATCIQHEVDHLDGIVTLDHLTEAARQRAEAEYEALS
jgi:peptide deformylase